MIFNFRFYWPEETSVCGLLGGHIHESSDSAFPFHNPSLLAYLFKFLKSQGDVIGVGGVADSTTGGNGRPHCFPIMHCLRVADGPAIQLQILPDLFPTLHLDILQ